jgi:hypothetical protein
VLTGRSYRGKLYGVIEQHATTMNQSFRRDLHWAKCLRQSFSQYMLYPSGVHLQHAYSTLTAPCTPMTRFPSSHHSLNSGTGTISQCLNLICSFTWAPYKYTSVAPSQNLQGHSLYASTHLSPKSSTASNTIPILSRYQRCSITP